VVGADKDKKWDSLWKEHPPLNAQNLIGKTSLPDLIKLCESARLVIANDSGVAHLAATLASAPVLVLFGPGNPDYIRPLGNKVSVVRDESLPCSPCEKPYCRSPYGFQRCLKNLDVSFIMTRVEELLRV
jgi:heptosyltransferase-2